jgi:hypothetical protein
VAQPEPYSGYQTGEYATNSANAQEVRAAAAAEIRAALTRRGFTESARAADIFSH